MTTPPPRLTDALTALRDQLATTPLGLATHDRDAARRAARAVADQIRCVDAAAGTMAEDEQTPHRTGWFGDENGGGAARRFDCQGGTGHKLRSISG